MFSFLSGTFDVFKSTHLPNRYFLLYQDIAEGGASLWSVTFRIGVYAILIAFVVLGINTLLNSSSVQERLQLKEDTKKNIIVSILFFSLVGLVTMVTKVALDW